jgi:hypothetical protein
MIKSSHEKITDEKLRKYLASIKWIFSNFG